MLTDATITRGSEDQRDSGGVLNRDANPGDGLVGGSPEVILGLSQGTPACWMVWTARR